MSAHLKAEEVRTQRNKNESGQDYSHRHIIHTRRRGSNFNVVSIRDEAEKNKF